MVDAFTPNRNIIQPQVGGDSGTWGGLLNNGAMGQIDTVLGSTQAVTITVADVTLTTAQWNNCAVKLTGALTGNRNLILPYQVGSASVAVGGWFVVDNETTGAFSVTVKTVAAGSVGVTVPQGLRTWIYSDSTNVYYADDAALHMLSFAGNPNGSVAGTAATAVSPPSLCWDYTNNVIYVCTTTGTASTAVWINSAATSATLAPPGGYITPVSNTPIITGDSISATVVYYTPFVSAQTPIHNGAAIVPYTFAQLQLTLSPSQAASNIYDAFLCYNGGVPVVGTGPSWAAGSGGSVTPGSCARGTGAGSTALVRNTQGFWVNANSMSVIYNTGAGNNTITVAAQQGIFLGSLYIDAVSGQITCHRSTGQSRKWGISNAYNRETVELTVADPTASWSFATAIGPRPSNNNTANSATVFQCLAEEQIESVAALTAAVTSSVQIGDYFSAGVGINSTSAFSGHVGCATPPTPGALTSSSPGRAVSSPALGLTTVTALEASTVVQGLTATIYGTEANNQLVTRWKA